MAPRKKSDNKTQLSKEKVTKAKAKTKNVIKLKIQPKKLKNATADNQRLSEENISADTELNKMLTLDRMNEVARVQLAKDCPVNTEEPPPKKRGRKKKIIDPGTTEVISKKKRKLPAKGKVSTKNLAKAAVKIPKETAKVVPKKKFKMPEKPKDPTKNTTKKTKNTPTESTDVVLKRSRKLSAKARLLVKFVATKAVKGPKVPAPKLKQLTTATKKTRGRPPNRGKPKPGNSDISSPSILVSGHPEIKTPAKEIQKPVPKSPAVPENNSDSRRASVTSAAGASELSWAKNISGSSTTTCYTVKSVNSNDFRRRPELKLKKLTVDQIEKKTEEVNEKIVEKDLLDNSSDDSSSSSCSSSSSSSSSSETEHTAFENRLNLSTSSISPPPYSPTYTPIESSGKNNLDEVTSIFAMIAPKLKSIDVDFLDTEGIEYDDMSQFEEKLKNYLEPEYNAVLECSFLDEILSESYVPKVAPEIEQKHSFAKPDLTVIPKSISDNRSTMPCNIDRRRDTYDPCDDDDALSLFAESLTGFDSTRISSAASVSYAPPNPEAYTPQPVMPQLTQRPTTDTTKIKEADSTREEPDLAGQVELERRGPHTEGGNTKEGSQLDSSATATVGPYAPVASKPPHLTISYCAYPHGKSLTLWGACFFNLMGTCTRGKNCYYPHRYIEGDEFRRRLGQLSEEQFFYEYCHIAKRSLLIKKYIKYFIDECQRRELPKILVEIVIDFLCRTHTVTPEDAHIRTQIVEDALLYLNLWNLSVCEQLLQYNIGGDALCDVFMRTIANTQNFSRFKAVFINLTSFMVRANRTFELSVAIHILERVCILPFETALATSVLCIIERTDRKIFGNHRIKLFEMSLNSFNKELYSRFLSIQTEGETNDEPAVNKACPPCQPGPPSLSSPSGSRGSRELEPLMIPQSNTQQEYQQRYTSPDTTNTDNVHKPVPEPVIIRTLNHLPMPRPNTAMCNPRPVPGPRPLFRNWNKRSIMSQIPRMPFERPPRPQKRPMTRPLPSEQPQFKYPRRNGPNF